MFKTMKSAEMLTVNGGGYYVPTYDKYNFYIGLTWTDKPNVKYIRYEYRSGGYQWWPHYY